MFIQEGKIIQSVLDYFETNDHPQVIKLDLSNSGI